MTNWNKYGSPLEINTQQNINSFMKFLESTDKEGEEPFWEIDEEGEIQPVSPSTERPKNYLEGYLNIVKWLKKRHRNCESGYAFTYQNEEDPNDPNERSVGAMNSNDEGVTFVEIDGNGKVTQEFHKI